MKIIITESQHSFIRRMELIDSAIDRALYVNDPCEYSRFEQYQRIVLNMAIEDVVYSENMLSSPPKERIEFKDNIIPLFYDKIRAYYDLFEEDC
jgi:hypothetical protein